MGCCECGRIRSTSAGEMFWIESYIYGIGKEPLFRFSRDKINIVSSIRNPGFHLKY